MTTRNMGAAGQFKAEGLIAIFLYRWGGYWRYLVKPGIYGIHYSSFVAWAVLVIGTLLALIRPLIPYDSWWYHLPFSSYLFDIGGGPASFRFDSLVTERWLGFPKAWEWVGGFAWAVSGSLHAVIIPQIILCFAYFYYLSRAMVVPIAWLILGFFASPMLLIHFEAIYGDLPAALCIALGFFLLLEVATYARIPDRPFPWIRAACAVVALGLAGNIKYQAFLAGMCVTAIVAVLCLGASGTPRRSRAFLLIVLMSANALASTTILMNYVRYGNPFYPLSVSLFGRSLFTGPESPELGATYPTYLLAGSHEVSFPEPVNFILSATELDWTMRGVAPWYNIDSVTGWTPRRGAPSRTGGWGGVLVLLSASLLTLQACRLRRETDRHQRLLVIAALSLVVLTACMPRSHELRYWLYLPLVVLPVTLRFLSRTRYREVVPGVLTALMAYGVIQAVLSPKSELLTPHAVSMATLRTAVPPAIAQVLRETGRYCDPANDGLFRYSQAVTGVHGLLSRDAKDCQ